MQPRLSTKGAAPRAAAAAGPGHFRKTDSGAAAGNDVHRKLLAGFHPRGVGSDQIKLYGGRLEHRRNCSFQIEASGLLVFEVHATEFPSKACHDDAPYWAIVSRLHALGAPLRDKQLSSNP